MPKELINEKKYQDKIKELEDKIKLLEKENKLLDRKLGDMLAGRGTWTPTGK